MKRLMIIMVSALCLSLVSCGGNKPVPEPEPAPGPENGGQQEEKPEPEEYVFTIDPMRTELPAEGGEFEVTVTCTGTYHLSSTPDWIEEKSVQDKKHHFSAAANPDAEARRGVIVFCDEVGTCIPCQVAQEAKP